MRKEGIVMVVMVIVLLMGARGWGSGGEFEGDVNIDAVVLGGVGRDVGPSGGFERVGGGVEGVRGGGRVIAVVVIVIIVVVVVGCGGAVRGGGCRSGSDWRIFLRFFHFL